MQVSWRIGAAVPALAAVAVTIAALAATVASRDGEPPEGTRVSGPPPALENVEVVKAPPLEAARRPVSCRDCVGTPAPSASPL